MILTIHKGKGMRTLLVAFEGFNQRGRNSAASMSKNSPSESETLAVDSMSGKTTRRGQSLNRPNDDIPPFGDLSEEPDNAPLIIDGVADAHATLKNVFTIAAANIWVWRNLELKGVAMPEEAREERWHEIMDAHSEGRARGLVSQRRRGVESIQQRVFRDRRSTIEDVHVCGSTLAATLTASSPTTSWLLPFVAPVRYDCAHILQGQNVDRGHRRRST